MNLGDIRVVGEATIPLCEMAELVNPEDTALMAGVSASKATIKIRLLSRGEQRRVDHASVEAKLTAASDGTIDPEMSVIPTPDRAKVMRFNACVVGWSGLYGEDGADLKCNAANKMVLIERVPLVLDFIEARYEALKKEAAKAKGAKVKN